MYGYTRASGLPAAPGIYRMIRGSRAAFGFTTAPDGATFWFARIPDAEERAAEFIRRHVTKPVAGYIAGFTAPPGKTMGHAGAIISGSSGTAQAKQEALEAAGVQVGRTPTATAQLMRAVMAARS